MSAHRILQNVSKFSSLVVNRMTAGATARVPKQSAAFISTSKKNRDTTTVTSPKTVEDFASGSKQKYQSYGFEHDDPEMDINMKNNVMFFTITVLFVGGGFIMMYFPDHRMKDWCQREAYIELARREALGLPAIDPNLVPPENVDLPSEEELGDFEIII